MQKQIENDIFVAFYNARSNRYIEEITEEEYLEILTDIHNKAMSRGKEVVTALLEEAYAAAENITMKNEALIHNFLNAGVHSLKDFIEQFPVEAFENEVLKLSEYCYEEVGVVSPDFISKRYFRNLFRSGELLFEYVSLLGGNTKRISQAFDKAKDIIKGHI